MTSGTDRRSVLTGLSAVAVAGCGRLPDRQGTPDVEIIPVDNRLDLSALETRTGGRLGFAALDAASGRFLLWRAEERFVYCSTFKMYLAAAVLLRVQDGLERLDRAVPVTRADILPTAPVTGPAVGGSLTIETLAQAVVEVSDNPAANILIREIGGLDAMRAFYRRIGDESTRVDRLEMELNRLDGDKDTITPLQSVNNLTRLLTTLDSPLSAASRETLLGWMIASPTGPGRLKAGAPAGWRVAHKTGSGGYGPTNDIGVLFPPQGLPITVAAYYHAPQDSDPAAREAVIADATRLALKAFGHD